MLAPGPLGLTVGLAQMHVLAGDPDRNLTQAVTMIAQAAKSGCAMVVLPECLDLGWMDESARELAQPIPGPRADLLAAAAREHRIAVVAGLTERAGTTIYNAAVAFNSEGDLLRVHRKITILDIARDLYTPGRSLEVVDLAGVATGVTICADNFPDTLELGRALARMGAQLIVSPSAWAVPPDHDNHTTPYGEIWRTAYGTLAADHHLAVIGVSNTGAIRSGAWTGYRVIGCSLAVGRDGEILCTGAYTDATSELYTVTV